MKEKKDTGKENELQSGAELSGGENDSTRRKTLHVVPGIGRGQTPVSDVSVSVQRKPQKELSLEEHVRGILEGDRVILSRTITLVESLLPEHNRMAMRIMEQILPHAGKAVRVGITGVPGVGKSTFIEVLGSMLTANGRRVAVLAIDPSSQISGGSIMGDKTRMEKLAADSNAFIRPSPSAGSLGGVARKTREVMMICEAAGFDVVLIETVGVGQSETMARSMVDFFLLLLLPNAGDQLQGVKRGIMELADAFAINKNDGDNVKMATHAKTELEIALHHMRRIHHGWEPPVHLCSARMKDGIPEIWESIIALHETMKTSGELERQRREQARAWMRDTISQALHDRFYMSPEIAARFSELERQVMEGSIPPLVAAEKLLRIFFGESMSIL